MCYQLAAVIGLLRFTSTWLHRKLNLVQMARHTLALLSLIIGAAMVFHGVMCLSGVCLLKDRLAFPIKLHGASLYMVSSSFVLIGGASIIHGILEIVPNKWRSAPSLAVVRMIAWLFLAFGLLLIVVLFTISAFAKFFGYYFFSADI